MRLFSLPKPIQEALKNNEISFGHAKVILSLPSLELQLRLFEKIKQNDLSVRETETLAKEKGVRKSKDRLKDDLDPYFLDIQEKLMQKFGTKVEMSQHKITINWIDFESLERILARFGVLDAE